MNLQQNINRIEKELAEMKLQLKQENTFWEPEDGTEAWYVGTAGNIDRSASWYTAVDKVIITQGQAFKTEQEALDEVKYRKTKYILRKEIWRLNGGKECPFIPGEPNYCVSTRDSKLFYDCHQYIKVDDNWFYLESENLCHQLAETHSKELKIYLGR